MKNNVLTWVNLMTLAHNYIILARADAILAKIVQDDNIAMNHDYDYAEHMAKAMHYLTRARKLRIKER